MCGPTDGDLTVFECFCKNVLSANDKNRKTLNCWGFEY